MQRLHSVDRQDASGRTRELLDAVELALGTIPNAARIMANSPAVLESFLGFSAAMNGAGIGEKLHNQIKLATSESNACDYCTSILTVVAPTAGLSVDEILASRAGKADDQRAKAALAFANDVLESRGKVGSTRIDSLRDAGFDDGEIVEIVASVVLGCFTNFLNNVADTELDIPIATPLPTAGHSPARSGTETCSTH